MRSKHLLSLILLAIAYAACANNGPPTQIASHGTRYSSAHLPYVEALELPEQVLEGEPFEITLHLSAELDPDMLRGITPRVMYNFGSLPHLHPDIGMVLNTWCWLLQHYISGDQIVTELHLPITGWPAGTYTVQVISAESREWGGVTDDFEVTPGFELPYSEHQVTREYTITVLPKEPAAQ